MRKEGKATPQNINYGCDRVYICHTFYHVYVAMLKELARGARNEAVLILSTMSNDFDGLKERLEKESLFFAVLLFEEKEDVTSPEVMQYHRDTGSALKNFLQRIRYTKALGRLQEAYVPTDLKQFRSIYVFCDSDPIGYYLNYKKIPYHAIEDGLNSGKLDDQARNSNEGAFALKCLIAKTGLIFIPSGYSRYCVDYEVNDISANPNPPRNIVEVPRRGLHEKLRKEDHEQMVRVFLKDAGGLQEQLREKGEKPRAMILTEPLCDTETRKRLFSDIIKRYEKTHTILIKPHPRDTLPYKELFPDTIVLEGKFPMEVLNDMEQLQLEKVISVITQMEDVDFAKEVVYLGNDFMDAYEAPELHRKNERWV